MTYKCGFMRELFHDMFGSRLNARLEEDLVRLREDFEDRLHDKDLTIAELRKEKSQLQTQISIYLNTLMPLASRAGAEVVAARNPLKPSFPTFDFSDMPPVKTSWQAVVDDWDKKMEEERRQDAIAAEEKKKQEAIEAQKKREQAAASS